MPERAAATEGSRPLPASYTMIDRQGMMLQAPFASFQPPTEGQHAAGRCRVSAPANDQRAC